MARNGILVDYQYCTGCYSCEVACQAEHELPLEQWGVKVSHDAGGTYPGVDRLMPYVDYLIPSEEFALKMTGEKSAEEAAQKLFITYHPEVLVLTLSRTGTHSDLFGK